MLKRRYGSSLSRPREAEEDVNPNSYIVNLADCMLVLMLGLIVALIAYYNIDLTQEVQPEDQIIGIEVNMDENQDGIIDTGYTRRGTVYYDESSGNYYFVTDGGA